MGGLLSGLPSTVHAVATGRDPLAAARAAGTIVWGERGRNVVAGAAIHGVITVWWTVVFDKARIRSVGRGAAAGLAVAVVDLGIVGRRLPAIRALPLAPQVLDHLAFGALAGACLGIGDASRPRPVEARSPRGPDRGWSLSTRSLTDADAAAGE